MAEINGVKMTDEQFMLSMELAKILQDEGYQPNDGEIDETKVKSERAHIIMKKLAELSESNDE